MSWSRCQLRVRDPQIFLLLPLLARPHRHAPILQTKPVDTSTLSVHESKLAPRAVRHRACALGYTLALVLARDAFRDGLSALEPAGGIEVRALLAGVQLKFALRALADGVAQRLQERTTLRTTGDGAGARHLDRTRTKGIFLDWSLGRLLLPGFFSAVLVTVLPVLQATPSLLLREHCLASARWRQVGGRLHPV